MSLSWSRVQTWPANTLTRFQCGVVLVIRGLERSAYLLLFYCDQVDLPILLSISSAVVLVTSEAFKGHTNQSHFPCQPQGCVPPHAI